MYVYLPIAEMPVNALLILALSTGVGFLSGMVGVGGGFIVTPLLFFLGVPPAVAVGSAVSLVTASSVSGALSYARRRMIDLRMAAVLSLGGVCGGFIGVRLLGAARSFGVVDAVISITYVGFLTVIGVLMLWESLKALQRKALGLPPPRRRGRTFAANLPLRLRFPKSGLYLSVLPPFVIGAAIGIIGAVMGVGGGFLLVPAMVYVLRMPAQVVVGTSLLVVLLTTAQLTVQQAMENQSVDLVLAALLIIGGVIGAQFGARAGRSLSAERLRATLGVVVLLTGVAILWELLAEPVEYYSLTAT